MIRTFTEADWDQAVLRSPLPVLAGFWAQWCIPSRAVGPLLEATAADFDGRVSFGLVDNDANPRLAERYRIQGLPTLLLIERGAEAERRVGLMDRDGVQRMLDGRLKRT